LDWRVKHLNPRQGITTEAIITFPLDEEGVKHLNPRQGITTRLYTTHRCRSPPAGVKHLNPRQGITTE